MNFRGFLGPFYNEKISEMTNNYYLMKNEKMSRSEDDVANILELVRCKIFLFNSFRQREGLKRFV